MLAQPKSYPVGIINLLNLSPLTFDEFLEAVDMVVLLVGHDEIRAQMEKLKGKVILDTRHICFLDGTYRL